VERLLDGGERRARVLVDHLPHVVLTEAAWRELDPAGHTRRTSTPPRTPPPSPAGGGTPEARNGRDVTRPVVQVRGGRALETEDQLAGEEPMELRAAGPDQEPVALLTTLRTPGHEVDLALGWLVAEGLLRRTTVPR
jgi:hypothetical protein